jgi:hypothetical protein
MDAVDGRLTLVIPDPAAAAPVTARGRDYLHCPACGRYSRETLGGLPDCVRHGVQAIFDLSTIGA